MVWNNFLIPLVIGFILDLIVGDPQKLPHPIRWFGSIIYWGERILNTDAFQRVKGLIFSLLLVIIVFSVLWGVNYVLQDYFWFFIAFNSLFVFYGLANRNLVDEGLEVEKALTEKGLDAARNQVSRIVGRETSKLSPQQIRIAVLETLSENLSDGVIAPLFYFSIGGIPAMFAYKMINTLDSMIGYKNERYKNFGCFAAKLDDVANFIPARITAFLMVIVSFSWRALQFVFTYGHKHASPNAGYPEAALAGILDCRFGGPNIYHGKVLDKPFIGKNSREVNEKDIKKAALVNIASAILFVLIVMVIWWLL